MLSPLLQKLLFINQFSINEGKIEILGSKYIMLDASNILVLQEIDKTKMYEVAKYVSEKSMKNLVEHAQVYKNIKDQTLKDIAELSRKIGKTDEGIIKTLQMIFEIYGLGKLEILDLDNKRKKVRVRIRNSSLALTQLKKSKSKNSVCTLTAGILAGIFTYIFAKNVECIEESCIAKGNESCEFKIAENITFPSS